MAQGDIHGLTLAGTYLGVPVAVSLAYLQEETDDPTISPGRDLISSWFLNTGGPWDYIREDMSDQLIWTCAVSVWGANVDTVYLADANGLSATASVPSTDAIQMNIPALFPHPDADEGRFFWPGFLLSHCNRSGFTSAFNIKLNVWEVVLLSLEGYTSSQSGAWSLVPHAKYLDAAGTTGQVKAWRPYHNEFVKVLGNRRPAGCAAFTGGGDGDFNPITIPPAGP